MSEQEKNSVASRRDFLKTSAATTATLLATGNYAYAAADDKIRLGVIGCGGRGSGAVVDCVRSSPNVELVAMGDLFPDRMNTSHSNLKTELGDKFKVADDQVFTGFDAYKKVLATDINLVILATPPGFRYLHLRAAVEAGKNVFMEKPVAVDAPAIRSVIASGEIAKRKGLAIVSGTQRRHDLGYNAVMQRLHDGAIGEIVTAQVYWNQGGLWMNARQAAWTDMEWQLRNWLYFTWLSGDHIVEQHVHNLDVMNWAFNNHPVKAMGMGGRQVRTDPAFGHIFDHFAIEYEFGNGARVQSMCRQIDGTTGRVAENIVGTKGTSDAYGTIQGANPYRYEGPRPNPYVLEHKDLIASIRAGKPLNEARRVAESTLTAIMGRMSAYSGQEITWEQALNSQESLMPEKVDFGPLSVPPVAIPGKTRIS